MANEAKLQAVIALTDKMSKPLKDVNTKLRNLQKPFKSLQGQLKQFDRLSGFNKLRSGLGSLIGQTAKLGAAAGVAAAGIGYMVSKTAEQGDKIAKNARLYGISGESLQEWTYIAERQGVAQETLNNSFLAFTKRMGEARSGTGALVTLLKKANPAFLDQLLATEGNEEAFRLVIDAMRDLKDPQRQAALASAAFSRSGIALTNIARASTEEIETMRDELYAFGGVMGKDAQEAAEKYMDSMTKLDRVMGGFKIMIAGELMPVITNLIERFGEWYVKNKDLIKQKIEVFAEKLGKKINQLADWTKTFLPKAQAFIDKIGGLKTIMIAAAAVIAGPLLSALVTVGSALLFTPVGLTLTAVAAGITVLVLGLKKLKESWGPIAAWFSETWQGIKDAVDRAWESIKPIIDAVKDFQNTIADLAPEQKQSVGGRSVNANRLRTQQTQVGGEINVKITPEGKPKVESIKSTNPDVGISADVGYAMVGM